MKFLSITALAGMLAVAQGIVVNVCKAPGKADCIPVTTDEGTCTNLNSAGE